MGLKKKRYLYFVSLLVGLSLVLGCAGHDHQHLDEVLPPPVYADPKTAQAMNAGNRLFKQMWWKGAEEQYRIAIQSFPSLAEAHYNLGLALNKLDRFKESHVYFTRALQLEPRNPVYRNAPPFRRYEDVTSERKPEPDSHGHSH